MSLKSKYEAKIIEQIDKYLIVNEYRAVEFTVENDKDLGIFHLITKIKDINNKVIGEFISFTDDKPEEIFLLKNSLETKIDFILGYILSNIEDYPVTLELSLPEKLNKKEMKKVEALIQSVKSNNLYYLCRQFKCGTCQENNPNSPIHFEIDYHYKWNRRQGIRAELGLPEEEKCFHCESIVTEDFCTVCKRDYAFKI